MAGPYSQGGGGGAAGSGVQIDSNALDKPYDLAWPWTADSVQKLDEMLRLLFLSTTQTASAVSGSGDVTGPSSVALDGNVALFNGTSGKIIKDGGTVASLLTPTLNGILPITIGTRDLTKSEINNWSANGPYDILAAHSDPKVVWVPIRAGFEKTIAAVYSANPTITLAYAGATGVSVGTFPGLTLTSTAYQFGLTSMVTFAGAAGTAYAGRALTVTGNANPTGGNAADVVRLFVHAVPMILQ